MRQTKWSAAVPETIAYGSYIVKPSSLKTSNFCFAAAKNEVETSNYPVRGQLAKIEGETKNYPVLQIFAKMRVYQLYYPVREIS